MKILQLANEEKVQLKGVWEELLDDNERYQASVITIPRGVTTPAWENKSTVETFYVINGKVELNLNKSGKKIGRKIFKPNTGWNLLPKQTQSIKAFITSTLFVVRAPIGRGKLSDQSGRNPLKPNVINILSDYVVNKPWGKEYWLVENGIYVLKGIAMNSGEQSSLQVHEFKREVNFVLEGRVDLALGYSSEVKKKIIAHRKAKKDQASFSVTARELRKIGSELPITSIGPGEGWKSRPFEIHRVFSKETYFALEISTPEVDDIVRLKDLYNRKGGRIESEHLGNKRRHVRK